MNTNVSLDNTANERVVDYGIVEGIPFVLTEKGAGNNIPRIKYIGNEIPKRFVAQIKNEAEEAKKNFYDFDKFNSFVSSLESSAEKENYTEGFAPPRIEQQKIEKGQEQLTSENNLQPKRFLQNQAEDVQINPTDTYQEVKPPENVESTGSGVGVSATLDELLK